MKEGGSADSSPCSLSTPGKGEGSTSKENQAGTLGDRGEHKEWLTGVPQ